MEYTLDKIFGNDIRIEKCKGIKLILQRVINKENIDLFFISPDALTKSGVIKGLVEDYRNDIPQDLLYDFMLLSLDFNEKALLDSLADIHEDLNITYLFAYLTKTGNIPFKMLHRVLVKFNEIHNSPIESFILNTFLLHYYFLNNNFEMAEKHVKYCLEYLENCANPSPYSKMVIFNLCAKYLEKTRDIFTKNAEGYYLSALKISEEIGDNISKAALLNSLAYFSLNTQNSSRDSEYAELALETSRILDIDSIKFTTFRNLGIVNITRGEFEKGTEYINIAIEYSYRVHNLPSIETIRLLNTLGFTYLLMSRFKESLDSHLRALNFLSEIENSSEILDEALKTFDNLSNTLRMLGDFDKAVYFADLSVKLITNTTSRNRANEVHNLCKQYTDVGIAYGLYTNDYDNCLKYYKLAKEIISEHDHYIKREKLNILDAYIRAHNGFKEDAEKIFIKACEDLQKQGSKNIYVQLLLIEFHIFFSRILENGDELLNIASEIASYNNLMVHYDLFIDLYITGKGIKDIPIDLTKYPINLILIISEERRHALTESKKAKDFELLEEFSKRINSAVTESDLYNEAEMLFNKYFFSRGFMRIRHNFSQGFSTRIKLNKDARLNETLIRDSITAFIDTEELLLSYNTRGFRLYTCETSNLPDNIKSMIIYNIYDDITSCSYFFVIFNDLKCNWVFTEGDAQAGLVLIKNLFLKFKHIQYVDSFKNRAITDSLTGLYNSEFLWTTLEKYTSQEPTDFIMVFIDLDKFKQINDTLGHATGDEAIKFFSQLLRVGFNPYNQIIRYGGDEFVVLLPGASQRETEELIARLKRLCLNNSLEIDENKITIDFSYGVDSYSEKYKNYNEFFKAVDELMYSNKRNK